MSAPAPGRPLNARVWHRRSTFGIRPKRGSTSRHQRMSPDTRVAYWILTAMPTVADLPFVVGIFVGPPLVLITCVLLSMARHARWVLATAVALSGITALSWVAYWSLWGTAFEYADTYRPVPPAVDRASNIAIAVCFVSTLMVAALGASRLVVAWRDRHAADPNVHRL